MKQAAMKYPYSKASEEKLSTCDPDLQRVFRRVGDFWDHTIIEGHREKPLQEMYFKTGRSKVPWPDGKHNKKPSEAVDAGPYPLRWPDKIVRSEEYTKDLCRWYMFAGFVLATACSMGINLRLGSDWDGDKNLNDQTFDDVPHFELVR